MTGSWILDHPVRAFLTFAAAATAGTLCGPLAAWITSTRHMLSPDNVLAGLAMGYGGVLLGIVAGAVIVARKELQRS